MKISKIKLLQIIKEELSCLNEIYLPQRIELKLKDLNEVMPAAKKICELLPFECVASIQYYWADFERTLTYKEAVAKYDSHTATHYGIQWISPILIISLGNSPSSDSHDDFFSISPAAGSGIFLSTGEGIFRSTIIKQENCEAYNELNYAIIDAVDDLLLKVDVVFKKNYNLDVDLD